MEDLKRCKKAESTLKITNKELIMARPGRPPKKKTGVDKMENNDTISVEGNLGPTTSQDATQTFTDDRNESVSRHNTTLSQVQHTQELKPATSTSNTSVAKKYQPVDILTVTGKKQDFFYFWIRNKTEDIMGVLQDFTDAVVDQDPDVNKGFMPREDVTGKYKNAKIVGDLILMRISNEAHRDCTEYWKSQLMNPGHVAQEMINQAKNSNTSANSGFYGDAESYRETTKF